MLELLQDIRACNLCAPHLPEGPRPVVQGASRSKLVIIGQAPGRKVHASGIPWDDASGKRLRKWLGMDEDAFYDPAQVAILPMGFCFPGTGPSGDLPPRPECAPKWHEAFLSHLAPNTLHLILGAYAIKRYVPEASKTLTETVKRFKEFMPERVVLPHPSPRNQRWFKNNAWFDEEVVPALQARVQEVLSAQST